MTEDMQPVPPARDAKPTVPESYRRAAEALADAAEDLLWCIEENQGDHREALRAAWQAYVEAADEPSSPRVTPQPTLPPCTEDEAWAEVVDEDRDVFDCLREQ